jgi:subtilisin family serine protease
MNAAGYGSPASYKACFQFFIAPTDLTGKNPDPDLAPDVVNNSWTCPREEGCDAESLHDDVNAVQAAGVMLVFAAGNSGPSCSTVMDPPATFPEMLSVGATDSSDSIASFSSRGPSTYDRGLKPNVSAPGVTVRSCVPNGGYTTMSGTSMAAPETAGVVALLWSARPNLKGDITGMSNLLEGSATKKFAPKCGGDSSTRVNNVFGYGLLNAKAALDKLTATGLK